MRVHHTATLFCLYALFIGFVYLSTATFLPSVFGYALIYGAAICFFVAAQVQLETYPKIVGKDVKTGEIPLWSLVLLWPFHFIVRVNALYINPFLYPNRTEITQIHDGWFVGQWRVHLHPVFGTKYWHAVADITCELPKRLRLVKNYLCLPTWDGTSPSVDAINRGVEFLLAHYKQGDVLVHCAFGRGRSVTVLVAALTAAGYHQTWRDAFAHVKSLRPYVKLNLHCRTMLDEWAAKREQQKTSPPRTISLS